LFIIYNDYDQANQTTMTNNFLPIVDREDLHPIVQEKTNELIEKAAEIDIAIVITDDYRSNKEQDKLYAQGRETPGPIVTNARGGQSMYNYGLAIDYALKNSAGEIIWDIEYDGNSNGVSDWLEVAEIAKDLGFSWGGDWAHFK